MNVCFFVCLFKKTKTKNERELRVYHALETREHGSEEKKAYMEMRLCCKQFIITFGQQIEIVMKDLVDVGSGGWRGGRIVRGGERK